MSTEELVSGVLEGLKLNALDLSALFRTALLILAGVVVIRVLLRIVDRMLSRSQNLGSVGGYIRSVVRIALWFLLVITHVRRRSEYPHRHQRQRSQPPDKHCCDQHQLACRIKSRCNPCGKSYRSKCGRHFKQKLHK